MASLESSDSRRGVLSGGTGGGGSSSSRFFGTSLSSTSVSTPSVTISKHHGRDSSPSPPSAPRSALGVISPPPRAALGGSSTDASHSEQSGAGHIPASHGGRDGTHSVAGCVSNNLSNNGVMSSTVAAQAATSLQPIRERDARIAQLERELSTMESVFQRELDKLSANESETASFWQAKHSTLQQQLVRAESELRLLRAEVDLWAVERDELRRNLSRRDAETVDLRAQVRGLKEWVSMSTRADDQAQTSDMVFADGMARLGNSLQNWVIVNFRRARIDLAKTDKATLAELERLVPSYADLIETSKIHLLQSLVSRILVDLVFDAYFAGIPAEQARLLMDLETYLSTFASTAEPINHWRSVTLMILKKDSMGKMQEATIGMVDYVMSRVNGLLNDITDTTSTETRNQGLKNIVTNSIDLSRLLVVQRAVFKVSMPEILSHQRILFDPATMEDIGGENEEDLEEREICCVTFPGIIKRGDETGGHLQYTNVISKARVLCRPD